MATTKTKAKTKPVKTAQKKQGARGRRANFAARLKTDKTVVLPKKDETSRVVRGDEVRNNVLHASLECFGAFGFEGTSTRAVAERAGVSHPLLLYHFRSKEKLWEMTMENVVGSYRQELEDRLALVDRRDTTAFLRTFIENFIRFSAKVPQLYRIMTQESTQGSGRISWLIKSHLRDSFNEVRNVIKRGQAEGTVRQGDSARLYYAIIGLGGTLLSVSTEFKELTGRDVFTESELSHTIRFVFDFLFI